MASSTPEADYRPYVPLIVRRWLDSDEAGSKHLLRAGSMVFADISGFTKLSERLDRIGLEGAEQVTEVIGDAFNRLLAPAYCYDGSLLKFGGDALLLFYAGDDHEVRAASSALEMRRALRAMGTIETPAGNVTLRMSQGIHSGEFHFFLVGDSFREFIIAGAATTQVAVVESEAAAGQIVVSEATAAALPAANLGGEREHGRTLRGRLLPLVESSQSVYEVDVELGRYVPSALRDPIARDAVVSEHRPATSAFIRFSGVDALLDEHPEAAVELFEELIEDVEAATAPRSIGILNTDVYPDGLKILLSAGAPITTGDDEENMLLALREIVGEERRLPLHIGVTRGPVFAGDVGTMFRRGYTVMGDQVNLAARLMSRAGPNQVLATDPVIKASRTLFDTTALEPFMVKGKSKPIEAFAVGDPRGARAEISFDDGPFLGRDAEFERLEKAWQRAKDGAGSLILVDGERGAGKSRLVAEFVETVKGCDVFSTVCRRYRSATPYFATSLVLWDVLGIDRRNTDEAADRLRAIVTAVDPQLVRYLSLIGTALGLDLPESQTELALADEFRKPRLEESVIALLSGLLTEPALFWVDDAQYMDDASADLFTSMVATAGGRPWLLAVSGRGMARAAEARQVEAPVIALGPLELSDATEVVHALTTESPLQPHLTKAIVERSQGNPMFLLELLAGLGEGNIEAMPESVEAVIASRIDRLLPDDKQALRALSVLGSGFRPEFAKVVLPQGVARSVLPRLKEFLDVEAEWVRFRNSLVHRAAYIGLPYKRRRDLHGRIAESIERSDGGADLLSVHYFAAGRWPEAWRYSRAAGDHAKEIYANLEAATLYERAIDAARWMDDVGSGDRARVLEALGDVRDLAGLFDEAKEAYRRVRKLVPENSTDIGRLYLKEAFLRERQGDLSQAIRWITKGYAAIKGVDGEEAAAIRAQLTVWRAAIRSYQGHLVEALEAAKLGIEEAAEAGDRAALARAYLIRDYAELGLGKSDGPNWSRQALEIYEELGDLAGVGVASNNLGGYAHFAGNWDEACAYFERSEEAESRIGSPVNAAKAATNMAEILSDQGHIDTPELRLSEAHRIFGASGDRWGVGNTERLLGVGASRRHDFEKADALFASSREVLEEIGLADEVFMTDLARVDSLILRGDHETALTLLDELLATPDPTSELAFFTARVRRLRGEALMRSGELGRARDDLTAAEAMARDDGADYELALALTALETLDQREGSPMNQDRTRERDQILEQLGVVRLPELEELAEAEHIRSVAPA